MSIELERRLTEGFAEAIGGTPDLIARAPGRVNLIGEHTDYNDGFALPVAIGMETRVALRRGSGRDFRVVALDYGEADTFTLSPDLAHAETGGWRDYVRGTLAILARAGLEITGADLVIAGDIPKGTGLSSSASLEVAVATAVLAASDIPATAKQVALWAQTAENDFVGMRCGNLDQLSAAATLADSALLIDCRSLHLEAVPLPSDAMIMIVQSGVVRGLVEGEYNARRRECEEAASVLGVPALRDADLAMLEAAEDNLRPVVFRRARHVIGDNARTLAARDCLASGDLAGMGRLMAESHCSQRDDFAITTPETDRLTDIMSSAIGGEGGARQTGGGFGGAVVGILRSDRVQDVCATVLAEYRTPSGAEPEIFVETAHGGACVFQA